MNLRQLTLFELPETANHKISDEDVIDVSKIKANFVGEKEMHRKSNIMISKLNSMNSGKYFLHKNTGDFPYVIGTRGKKLSISTTRNQYPCVGMGGVVIAMHRLVALAFVENDDTSKKLEVDHINDDKSDYRVENLQWVTNGFNSKKAQQKRKSNKTND